MNVGKASNTSIKGIIIALVIVFILIIASIGFYGFTAAGSMRDSLATVYNDRVVPLKQLGEVREGYTELMRTVNETLLNELSASESLQKIGEATTQVQDNWNAYIATFLVPDEKALVEKLKGPMQENKIILTKMAEAIRQMNKEETLKQQQAFRNNMLEISKHLSALFDVQLTVAETEYKNADATYANIIKIFSSMAVFCVFISIATFFVVRNYILRPINNMAIAMTEIANEKYETSVPNLGSRNEMGILAHALDIFKKNGIERKQMTERQLEEARVKAEKATRLDKLTREFDQMVSQVLDKVAASASEMEKAAVTMSGAAEETSRQANLVSNAAENTSSSVQTVAAATEEMSASINEISQRVQVSTNVATKAANDAERGNMMVQNLTDAAQAIGGVIETINSIAAQINLLALNATIEAARAGDAGKGFAVVASEVKALATQTAKATGDVEEQIKNMQKSTDEVVGAIQSICGTINEINTNSAAIAAAVQEQGVVTQDIAKNAQTAASGTSEVSSNISGVTTAASNTSSVAHQVLSTAEQLGQNAKQLRHEVVQFLTGVKTA